MIEPVFVGIAARSYDERQLPDRHDFAQLVLPLAGQLHLHIAGKQGTLDPLQGAIVEAGAWHFQHGTDSNLALILDVDQRVLTVDSWSILLERPFTTISPAARKLAEFMYLCIEAGTAQPERICAWMPLLFDTLAMQRPQARSRLGALLAHVEAHPGLPWSAEAMARFASLSTSRLHALFQQELGISPRAWLLKKRIDLACELLTHSDRAIIDVALSTGFADQSALTRAMRHNLDATPAVYRRQRQEPMPKSQ